jgi:hypothetical protein
MLLAAAQGKHNACARKAWNRGGQFATRFMHKDSLGAAIPASALVHEDAMLLQPAQWAGHVTKERKMVKRILAALLLASAVAFAPVAASAHYTGYRHHHHGYGHHYHHYCR